MQPPPSDNAKPRIGLAASLSLLVVAIGIVNTMPVIPGLRDALAVLTGIPGLEIRSFPFQYLNPLAFLLLLLTVVVQNSAWASAAGKSPAARALGLGLDVALVLTAVAVPIGYMIESDSICLIDQITGERARVMAGALEAERAMALSFGLPPPTSVQEPACMQTLGQGLIWLMTATLFVLTAWTVRVWGWSLAAVSIAFAVYSVVTVLVWYIWGTEGFSKYLVTKLGPDPRQLADGIPALRDALTNGSQALIGRFTTLTMGPVFPYIVLGGLFGASAGGRSLIKIAFIATRRLRGGPAHAAVMSSALFGTVSGGPVVNVLSTGVLTIPMMRRNGFSPTFAGGVEAAASSGGQIMPPVMGVAAFVLATMTLVPYREVMIAAILPCLAYFFCLSAIIAFEARKRGIERLTTLPAEFRMSRGDWLNLTMIVLPMALIVALLMTPKEAIGCGPVGLLFGVERVFTETGCRANDLPWALRLVQNSAGDAASAGWWAAALLAALFFLDPEVRARPARIVDALSRSGVQLASLFLLFLAVAIIDFCMNFTGLASYVALDITHALRALLGGEERTAMAQLLALTVTMLLAIILGMGMPTVPAYLNVALLMGPMLSSLGVATFTAHMFIFFFAVASAITPPVAVAAFAAASVSGGDPMRTALAAVRVGIVMFAVPFVFAFHPELLLISAAQLDPLATDRSWLPGYDGTVSWQEVVLMSGRFGLAIVLLASVITWHGLRPLSRAESTLRLAACVALVWTGATVPMVGTAVGVSLLIYEALTMPPSRSSGLARTRAMAENL